MTVWLPKKTKIVCTIGPASLEPETLEQMAQAGMTCARINTAYGDFDRYKTVVELVREVAWSDTFTSRKSFAQPYQAW